MCNSCIDDRTDGTPFPPTERNRLPVKPVLKQCDAPIIAASETSIHRNVPSFYFVNPS